MEGDPLIAEGALNYKTPQSHRNRYNQAKQFAQGVRQWTGYAPAVGSVAGGLAGAALAGAGGAVTGGISGMAGGPLAPIGVPGGAIVGALAGAPAGWGAGSALGGGIGSLVQMGGEQYASGLTQPFEEDEMERARRLEMIDKFLGRYV